MATYDIWLKLNV